MSYYGVLYVTIVTWKSRCVMLKHNTVNMVHNALEHSHCGVNFTTEDSDQLKHVKEMQIIQNERDRGRK